MRCKKHTSDLSSTVGVCASCLRDQLFALIAAQAQAQAQVQVQVQAPHQQLSRSQSRPAVPEHPRKSDTNLPPPPPPPLVFPRSVSPYVSRRKSADATWQHQHRDRHDRRFYGTPQVGPTFATVGSYRKKNDRFSLFSKLFRSRSEKLEPDPRVSSQESCEPSSSTYSSSPSWFNTIFSGSRKKQSRLFVVDESATNVDRKPCRRADRGMSPARTADSDEDCNRSASASGYSSDSWPSPAFSVWRTRQGQRRHVSGTTFCLSPLVRATPKRHWNQKGLPPDVAVSGEIRVPGTPQLPTAASFCKNRSRKLADFGRASHNR